MSEYLPTPSPGFAPAPVNSTQWNAQVVEAQAQKRLQDTQDRTFKGAGFMGMIPDWIKTPVEAFGSFAHSAYTNVISRPLSTVMLASYIGSAESNSMGESWSNLFDGDIWDRAWNDSKHVSPGQAIAFGVTTLFSGKDMREASMQPVMYKPTDTAGNRIIDQTGKPVEINLNQNGLLWDNPDAVRVKFDSGVQKYLSGGLDLYVGWYADPLALAGKGVGAARNLAYVRPAIQAESKGPLLTRPATYLAQKTGLIEAGRVGTSKVEKNLGSNAFTSFGDNIMKQKAKLGDDGFSEWVTNQAWAKNSADSGALAHTLGNATDRADVDQILAVSMGSREALQTLTTRNTELGAEMAMLAERKNGLLASNPVNVDPTTAAKLQLQLDNVSQRISAIEAEKNVIGKKVALQDSMKNGMYFNPYTSPLASNFGQYARGLETMKAADASGRFGTAARYAASLVYNNLYVRPVRVISGTTWNGIRAPGHIDIDAEDSHRALSASLQQANVFSKDKVQSMVSDYINADRATKDYLVQQYDHATVQALAMKYGMTPDQASTIYKNVAGLRGQAMSGRVYSTGYVETASGGRLRADHVADDGSLVTVHPVFNSQLQNTHVLTDYEHMDRMLRYTSKPFQRLIRDETQKAEALANGPVSLAEAEEIARKATTEVGLPVVRKAQQMSSEALDGLSKLWKFNVLFRLGYGPRAIADDFMGQVARLGATNMFFDRTLIGGRNLAMRKMNHYMGDPTGVEQQLTSIDIGLNELSRKITDREAKIERINAYLPASPQAGASYLGRGAKGRKLMNQRSSELQKTQAQLDDFTNQRNVLREQRNRIGQTQNALGDRYQIMPDGTAFPLPYQGPHGPMYKDMMAGRRTIDSMIGGTATDMWNQFRKGDWRVLTAADGNNYVSSYLRVLQNQFKTDKAAMAAIRGEDMVKWLGSAEGRAYRADSAMKNMSVEEHADRMQSTIDHVLPASTPDGVALREALINGESDAKMAELIKKIQRDTPDHAPDIQGEGIAYNMGKGDFFDGVNRTIDKFYDIMNRLPAEHLSRNPVFFQLYRQHASEMWQMAKDSGVEKISAREQERIAEQARKLAVKDVKKLTFNMDYETKIAHALRFIAPFFGPMQESFTRWGRIVADKPEVLARAANIYTAPIRAGHAVDKDGNLVGEDGYVRNPDGSKRLVPKDEMHIQFQAPQWLAKAIGQDQGSIVDMPINTLNLVLQNDPWYNPGTGPWVQLPANWIALRSDPSIGDAMTKLGILQNVTENQMQQVTGSGPSFIMQILGQDDYKQQQRDMAYLMQSEDYKWKTGMRDTEPTWKEIKDRTEHSALLRGWMKAALPVSSSFKDPYQYFRDRYRELTLADPKTADQVFLAKYGSAAFSFTGAMTYNKKGLPASVEAVLKDQKYSYLTDADPDLASVIVGLDSSQPFSQTAYVQQMRSGQRQQLDAADVMKRSEANAGWAQYDKYMNILNANLKQAGFMSFSDHGAEKFDSMRKGLVAILTSPDINGKKNGMYNEQFAKDFLTIDRSKDERIANAMNSIVKERTLIEDPMRSDIRSLATYMDFRNSMKQTLAARNQQGGSADITAKSNADLRLQFSNAAHMLVESDTKFESLYNRWLSRDMYDQHNPMGAQ